MIRKGRKCIVIMEQQLNIKFLLVFMRKTY